MTDGARGGLLSRYGRPAVVLALWAAPLPLLQSATVRSALTAGAEWMRAHGIAAVALYSLIYAAGALIAAPFALLNVIAGFAYGPVVGALVGSLSGAIATGVVHAAARRSRLAEPPAASGAGRFARVMRMLARADLKTAILLRASPLVPQNLLSFAFPFTGLGAPRAMLATLIGLFPMTCVHAYVGSLVANAAGLIAAGRPSAMPGPGWTPYAAMAITVVTLGASALTLRAATRKEA